MVNPFKGPEKPTDGDKKKKKKKKTYSFEVFLKLAEDKR
jgi:hypothetical protein